MNSGRVKKPIKRLLEDGNVNVVAWLHAQLLEGHGLRRCRWRDRYRW